MQTVERCDARIHDVQCVLSKDHYGEHEAQIELPPDLGMIIAEHLTEMEEETREVRRLKITLRWLMVFNVAGAALLVLTYLVRLFG